MKRIMTLACIATMASAAFAETAPDDVAFTQYGELEQSLSGQPGDPEAGKAIMVARGKGNCIACHQVTALEEFPFHGNVGPSLDGIGSRRSAAELRGIIVNAKMTFEGTIMPAFYRVSDFTRPGDAFTGKAADGPLSPLLTAQEIEDVVAYLQTLQD
ncbi:sulfur oxidation c-type cytochrome SoxX [Yoonia sp.]|uniref:sulfur oxidation c-type cytochrome SoxX n=1 Tax=Yoonia sp. TaxID=2212373 RepID=UPI0025DE05CB|nr:sulfur oxidation c-type cytochrome SoxX [Yoonia sp.]